jgi:phosphate uptake regulator
MRRKLVKQGVATMMVSLPSKWIKQQKLKKGDEIEISETDGSLLITTSQRGEVALKKEVSIPTPEDYMNRLIDMPYVQGYDEIVVHFDDARVMDSVVKETQRLLGMEVVRQSATGCVIKNVAEAMEQEFDNIFRRLFLLVKSMAEDSIKAAKAKDYEKLKNIADLERMTHKYALFCMRMLNKYGYKKEKDTHFVFNTVYSLLQVAQHYEDLCKHIAATKEKIDPATMEFFKQIVALTDDYYQAFYKRDLKHTVAMKHRLSRLRQRKKAGKELLDVKRNVFLIHHLKYILEQLTYLSYFLI